MEADHHHHPDEYHSGEEIMGQTSRSSYRSYSLSSVTSSSSPRSSPPPTLPPPQPRPCDFLPAADTLRSNTRKRRSREFIPESNKDQAYWDRRRRNNEAAKRSREKRRVNDIILESKVLELTKENSHLRAKLEAIYEWLDIQNVGRDDLPKDDLLFNPTPDRKRGQSCWATKSGTGAPANHFPTMPSQRPQWDQPDQQQNYHNHRPQQEALHDLHDHAGVPGVRRHQQPQQGQQLPASPKRMMVSMPPPLALIRPPAAAAGRTVVAPGPTIGYGGHHGLQRVPPTFLADDVAALVRRGANNDLATLDRFWTVGGGPVRRGSGSDLFDNLNNRPMDLSSTCSSASAPPPSTPCSTLQSSSSGVPLKLRMKGAAFASMEPGSDFAGTAFRLGGVRGLGMLPMGGSP